MGQGAACYSHCECHQESSADLASNLRKYKNDTPEEQRRLAKMLQSHNTSTEWCNVPLGLTQHGLVRPRDGLAFQTDLVSLTDVDGDGIDALEVIRAILMQPPGAESMAPESEGGELLYPDLEHEREHDGQSAVEMALRLDMKQLLEKLMTLERKVKNHRSDLETEGGRDTQVFLQDQASNLVRQITELAVEVSSESDKRGGALKERLETLAKQIENLAQDASGPVGSQLAAPPRPASHEDSPSKKSELDFMDKFGGTLTSKRNSKSSSTVSTESPSSVNFMVPPISEKQ